MRVPIKKKKEKQKSKHDGEELKKIYCRKGWKEYLLNSGKGK